MSGALWLLLWLHLSGWLRYLGRSVRSVRGVLLLLVGLAVFLPWLGFVLFGGNEGRMQPTTVSNFGPVLLLVYCLLNVIFSPEQRAIYFSPAEVQFLFAGPFTRREVLVYKIVLTLMVSLPTALILGVVVRFRGGWPPALLPGLLLTAAFIQLFTLALGLLAIAVGSGMYTSGRRLAGVLLLALVGFAVLEAGRRSGWDWQGLGDRIVETAAWRYASYPLRSFFDLLLARSREQMWPPLLAAAGVDVGLVLAILALDVGYQETSAAASARRYATLQRLRGRSGGVEAPMTVRRSRFSLPALPYLGGAGPVLWRQMTTAVRALGRLMMVLLVLSVVLGSYMSGALGGESPRAVLGFAVALVGWLSIFITTLVPFDFRGDLDRIALLKTLPIRPWRLTVGQLLTPVLLLTGIQWLAVALLVPLTPPEWYPILASAAVVMPCFNWVLIALDNLLFLLFPVRIMAATPGDFQALGRNVVLSMGKLMGLAVVAAFGGLAVGVTYVATESLPVALLAACPVLLAFGAALVPLIALAFTRFDVGRDTPA